jgi:hypothetical protein
MTQQKNTKRPSWNPSMLCKNGCPASVRPGFTVCEKCLGPRVVEMMNSLAAKGDK